MLIKCLFDERWRHDLILDHKRYQLVLPDVADAPTDLNHAGTFINPIGRSDEVCLVIEHLVIIRTVQVITLLRISLLNAFLRQIIARFTGIFACIQFRFP